MRSSPSSHQTIHRVGIGLATANSEADVNTASPMRIVRHSLIAPGTQKPRILSSNPPFAQLIPVLRCFRWNTLPRQPGGRKKIAQRFIAGSGVRAGRSPAGTTELWADTIRRKPPFYRPCGTLSRVGRAYPAMNRWAIVGRPCGTGRAVTQKQPSSLAQTAGVYSTENNEEPSFRIQSANPQRLAQPARCRRKSFPRQRHLLSHLRE